MISGANEIELEIANARADVLLSINDDRQHLLGLIKYWREECFRYKKENEAYENMRKEAIEYCNSYCCWIDESGNFQESDFCIDDLLNILNKVGDEVC